MEVQGGRMKNKKEILKAIEHVLTAYKNGDFHDSEVGSVMGGKNWIEVTQKQKELLNSLAGSEYSVSFNLNENYNNEKCRSSGALGLTGLQVKFKEGGKTHYYVSMTDSEFYPWAEMHRAIEMLLWYESSQKTIDKHVILNYAPSGV